LPVFVKTAVFTPDVVPAITPPKSMLVRVVEAALNRSTLAGASCYRNCFGGIGGFHRHFLGSFVVGYPFWGAVAWPYFDYGYYGSTYAEPAEQAYEPTHPGSKVIVVGGGTTSGGDALSIETLGDSVRLSWLGANRPVRDVKLFIADSAHRELAVAHGATLRDRTRVAVLHVEIVDEAEVDHVDPERGVDDVLHRLLDVPDRGLGNGRGGSIEVDGRGLGRGAGGGALLSEPRRSLLGNRIVGHAFTSGLTPTPARAAASLNAIHGSSAHLTRAG